MCRNCNHPLPTNMTKKREDLDLGSNGWKWNVEASKGGFLYICKRSLETNKLMIYTANLKYRKYATNCWRNNVASVCCEEGGKSKEKVKVCLSGGPGQEVVYFIFPFSFTAEVRTNIGEKLKPPCADKNQPRKYNVLYLKILTSARHILHYY